LALFGLAVTLTFDLFISIFNQLIFIPKCAKCANLVKLPQVVYETSSLLTLDSCTDQHMHRETQNITLPLRF